MEQKRTQPQLKQTTATWVARDTQIRDWEQIQTNILQKHKIQIKH